MRKTCYTNVTKKIIHPSYLFQKLEYTIEAEVNWGEVPTIKKQMC